MNRLVFTQDDTEYRAWIAENFAAVDTEFEGVMTLHTHAGDRPQVGLADLCYTMAAPRSSVRRPYMAHYPPYTNIHVGLDVAMLNLSEFMDGPQVPFFPLKEDAVATVEQIADYFRASIAAGQKAPAPAPVPAPAG